MEIEKLSPETTLSTSDPELAKKSTLETINELWEGVDTGNIKTFLACGTNSDGTFWYASSIAPGTSYSDITTAVGALMQESVIPAFISNEEGETQTQEGDGATVTDGACDGNPHTH